MHQQEKRTKKQPAANNKKWRQAYIKNGNYIQSYSITLVKRCKDLLSHIGRIFPYKNVFLSVSLTQQLTNHEL